MKISDINYSIGNIVIKQENYAFQVEERVAKRKKKIFNESMPSGGGQAENSGTNIGTSV